MAPELQLVPCTIGKAQYVVRQVHRHLPRVQGGLFAVGVMATPPGELVGVAIVGRPSARFADNGATAEVVRVAVKEGFPNACSMLYGAARRAAKALGYSRIVTYTLGHESGTSLRAAGWFMAGRTRGGAWSRDGRPRMDLGDLKAKQRWEAQLAPGGAAP